MRRESIQKLKTIIESIVDRKLNESTRPKRRLKEAYSVDASYMLRDLKQYNSGILDMDELVDRLYFNSGARLSSSQETKNKMALRDHLGLSMDGDRMPTDSTFIKELNDICRTTNRGL